MSRAEIPLLPGTSGFAPEMQGVLCVSEGALNGAEDCCLAAQNIMRAAHSQGFPAA